VTRPRAADDFITIRARISQLRREAAAPNAAGPNAAEHPRSASGEAAPLTDHEQRLRERREGHPPPWVPTIFLAVPDAAPDGGSDDGHRRARARYSAG
jgi:hypothetical protein